MGSLLASWKALPPARQESLRRLLFFVLVGGAATVTHYCAALAANRFAGLAPFTANLAGYSSAVAVSYLGHSLLTFRRPVMLADQFLRFVVVSLAGLAIGQAITFLTTDVLDLPFAIALVPVVTLVPVFTYIASSLWAFASQGSKAPTLETGSGQARHEEIA